MKVLHLSFHYGCISDINTVFKTLNHDITSICTKHKLPYQITLPLAKQHWAENKDYYNTFDIILTSDTVSLSYIFTLHLQELVPHLIILNCNRFSYNMEGNQHFIQTTQQAIQTPHKVTYIPYTDFERIWTGKHNLFLHERAIQPLGKYIQHINSPDLMKEYFQTTDHTYQTKPFQETIFLQRYHNHVHFLDLPKLLHNHHISTSIGSYTHLAELKPYQAILVLPDQFSKYFTYESIQEQLLVLLPSQAFLLELVNKQGYYFNVEGSSGHLTNDYINLCEWYKYPEARLYFHSFDHLITLLNNLTPELIAEKKKWCAFYGKVIEEEHMMQWKHVVEKIALLKNQV
jgi:hypothetical protein